MSKDAGIALIEQKIKRVDIYIKLLWGGVILCIILSQVFAFASAFYNSPFFFDHVALPALVFATPLGILAIVMHKEKYSLSKDLKRFSFQEKPPAS